MLPEEYKEFIRLLIAKTNERKLTWSLCIENWFRTEIYNGYSYSVEREFAGVYVVYIKVFHESGMKVFELMIPGVDREDYSLVSELFTLLQELVLTIPTIIEITNSLKKLNNE